MKALLTLACVLTLTAAWTQGRQEIFDYAFKPVKGNGGYYYVVTEKTDSGWKRQAWYISQKTLYMDGRYKDDSGKVKHGEFRFFHPNGKLRETGRYANDRKEGPWLRFDEDGRLDDSSNYAGGRLKGVGFGWHDNGYLADSTNFDGAGNGVQVRWYDDGAVLAAGYWANDTLRRGRWKYYHRNGTVMATEEYDQSGKLTLCECYDEKGAALDTALCREKAAKVDVQKWKRYLEKSLTSLVEQKAAQGITGNFTVVVRFVITEEGKAEEVAALTNYGYGIEEGVVRIIKNSPAWIPARVHGRTVKSYHMQPVTFVISEGR